MFCSYLSYNCHDIPQINDNGIISFNSRYNVRTPLSLPLRRSNRIIAPYWADVDTRGTGRIVYRQTSDPTLIAKAASEIRRGFPKSQNVTITNLLIVTWDAVGYYYRNSDKVCMYTLISAYFISEYYQEFMDSLYCRHNVNIFIQ